MTSDRFSPSPSTQKSRLCSSLAVYLGLSFVLHLIWENVQAPLYTSFDSFLQHFLMCLFATATGDMLFMLTIYIALAAAFERLDWPAEDDLLRRPATWVLSLIIGGLLAVSFELWAIHVEQRWFYDTMPTIPVLEIGILPLLQMLVIPVLVIAATHYFVVRFGRRKAEGFA